MAHTDHPRFTDRIDRRITRKTRPAPRRQGTRSAIVAAARKEG